MDNGEVYLSYAVITTTWLRWLGQLFLGGITKPIHCRLYWGLTDPKGIKHYFMTELRSDVATSVTEVVGKGDGYEIQITPVFYPEGTLIPNADAGQIDGLARQYASIEKGNLNSTMAERDWYCEPQGYGGPMYEPHATSNTYAWWILNHICKVMPVKPVGALGWGDKPHFPGPKDE